METLTINKANWSGEEATVKLYADSKRLKVVDSDIMIRVKKTNRYTEEDVNLDVTEYTVEMKDGDEEWQETDFKVHTDHTVGEQGWHYATTWNGGSPRESTKDVRLAVIKLLFNVY